MSGPRRGAVWTTSLNRHGVSAAPPGPRSRIRCGRRRMFARATGVTPTSSCGPPIDVRQTTRVTASSLPHRHRIRPVRRSRRGGPGLRRVTPHAGLCARMTARSGHREEAAVAATLLVSRQTRRNAKRERSPAPTSASSRSGNGGEFTRDPPACSPVRGSRRPWKPAHPMPCWTWSPMNQACAFTGV